MAEVGGKIRLFVGADLGPDAEVPLDADQAHYLFNVMRLGQGAPVTIFNGRDGEWFAEVARVARNGGALRARAPGQPQRRPPDLTLIFAPIKKARTDFIVEKAAELGCARVQPVFTRHTNAERLRVDRLRAHAIEAAEQCGETYVAEVAEPLRLGPLLDGWDPARRLMFCDESRDARPAAEALAAAAPGPWAILIGPEGGFAPEETARLRGLAFVLPVTLGPRVLRADTAAVAAITLWQAALGGLAMSFILPERAAQFRRHRESLLWGALTGLGLWLLWQGYAWLAPLSFGLGLLLTATGAGLLRDSQRRARLRAEAPEEGVVLIDEARIGYFGPREGGFIDLPAITAVEMITRPHLPSASGHAWLISAEDGTRLTIPLGAQGAERLFDALSALPGIDFDAGVAAVVGPGARRATVWKKAG